MVYLVIINPTCRFVKARASRRMPLRGVSEGGTPSGGSRIARAFLFTRRFGEAR